MTSIGVLGVLVLEASSIAIGADVSSQWNGGTGDWIEPLNWTHSPNNIGADYPDNDLLTYDVHFGQGEAVFPIASLFTIENLWMSGGTLRGHTTLTLREGFHASGTGVHLDLTQINMMRTSRWDAAAVTVGEATHRIINHGVQELSDVQVSLLFYEYGTYENHGLLRKASGTAEATIDGEGLFTSDRRIVCSSGILSFAVPCFIQGQVEAEAGAEVRFVLTSTHFLRPTFSGSGSIVFQSGPVWMDLAATNSATIQLNGAAIECNGPDPSEVGAFVNETNGVIKMGSFSHIHAYLINRGQLLLDGPRTGFSDSTTILNHGLLVYADPEHYVTDYVVRNYGELQVSNANIDLRRLQNHGSIYVSAGRLDVSRSGTNSGILATSTNGAIRWWAPCTMGASSRLDGNLTALGDTFVQGDTTNYGVFHLGAELSGPGNLYLADGATLLWAANMKGPGQTVVRPGGSLVPAEYGGRLSGRTIINEPGNTLRWDAGGTLELDSGTILNRGRFEIVRSMTIWPSGVEPGHATLHNEGTFRIASTNGLVTLDLLLTNTSEVVVESDLALMGPYVQTAGNTILRHGLVQASDAVHILGGQLAVDGIFHCGVLQLDSTMSLSSTSSVAAQLLLTNSSVVDIEIGPAGSGVVHGGWEPLLLNGTLRLRLADGFVPSVGTRYTLFTEVAPIDTFLRYAGLEIGGGLRLVPQFDVGRLDVVVMNAPQPGQKALTLTAGQFGTPELSWPPEFAGFYLQHTTNLAQPDWRLCI